MLAARALQQKIIKGESPFFWFRKTQKCYPQRYDNNSVKNTISIWQSRFCLRWQFGKTVYFLTHPTMNNLAKTTMGKRYATSLMMLAE